MSNINPYSVPNASFPNLQPHAEFAGSPVDLQKIQSIIKDAKQFWLAIIICFFCGIIGAIAIPIWFTVRLVQWRSMAKKYPALLGPNPQPGSLSQQFQSSQWKLIVGLVCGFGVLLLLIGLIILNVAAAALAVR